MLQIREAVSVYSAQRSEELLLACPPSQRQRAYIAQMPKSTCTFTGLRKLYLNACSQPVNHSASGRDDTRSTNIEWLSGKFTAIYFTLLLSPCILCVGNISFYALLGRGQGREKCIVPGNVKTQ